MKIFNAFNKLALIAAVFGTMAMTTGCSKSLSHGITNMGHVETSDLVFPERDDAWQKDGQFPNLENLSKIKAGIGKDELYYLIDRPHFSEAQHAREWDYIFKFYQQDDSVKICQYKVIFDEEYKGQEFYWLPADCAQYAQPQAPQAVAPQVITQVIERPVPQAPMVRHEKITLDADALFKFDRSDLRNMLPQGRNQLNELASQLKSYSLEGDLRISLTGHTDYKGSQEYNYTLSQRRANTVLAYLAQRGISPATMSASGLGEDFPVKQCSRSTPRQQEIECLQPNRRVDVDVIISQF